MHLQIFQSSKGDCVLLEGSGGGRVLCDGGMAKSMRKHVRRHLSQLTENDAQIDAVYISHIDQDHISGILQLLEDKLEWRVFDHHRSRGDTNVREPRFPRPPEIGGIWHNSFRDLITRNRGRIENLLAASAPLLSASSVEEAAHIGFEMQNIANSIPEALKVSALIKSELLDIPLNSPPGHPESGQLLLIEDSNTNFDIGSLSFQIVGPSKRELRKLREGWNNWLRVNRNRERTRAIRREMRRRVDEFANGTRTDSPFDLRDWNGIPDFEGVTVPNTASLMFLVEEDGHTLLLTGDSQQDVILDGLEATGNLEDGFIHVDILKVPHHGSENNADINFCKRVSADHYVFCGDGSHGNPEPEVIKMYFDSRLGSSSKKALSPAAEGRDFKFWFSTSSDSGSMSRSARRNFEETERLVSDLVSRSGGRMSAEFNDRDYVSLRID